jgi:hypothetical protein
MSPYGNGYRNMLIVQADRFRTDKRLLKKIFVDDITPNIWSELVAMDSLRTYHKHLPDAAVSIEGKKEPFS